MFTEVIYRFLNQFYSIVERCLCANAAILSLGNVFLDHRLMGRASLVRTLSSALRYVTLRYVTLRYVTLRYIDN
jgi:hypothetical protein